MKKLPTEFIDAQTLVVESVTKTEETNFGGNFQATKIGNQHYWQIEFRTPPNEPAVARRLNAFLNSLDGKYGVFEMDNPEVYSSGVMTVANTVSAGQSAVNVNDNSSATVGDFVRFSNHSKTYQIIDVYSDVIEVYPPLFFDLSSGDTVGTAIFELRLSRDKNSINRSAKQFNVTQTIVARENV